MLRGLFLLLLLAACGDSVTDLNRQICFPGEVRCNDDATVEVCVTSGTRWAPGACGTNQVCTKGDCGDPLECPDACQDQICQPGARVCANDNVFVYECDGKGTGLISCGSCAVPPINGVCFEGNCVSLCDIEQKSYLGCEYFAADLDNARLFSGFDTFGQERFLDAEGAQYAVVISNPNPSRPAFISITRDVGVGEPPGDECIEPMPDDSFVAATILPPGGIHVFALPPRNIDGTVKGKLAYRVASNLPITAYQFNPLENVDVFSNDASLLLPTTAIGKNYVVMTRGQTFDELKGFFTVVGVNPLPTEVTVQVSARTLGGNGIPPMEAGETFTTTLAQYEVLNIETNQIGADLTGSTITASRNVTVYAGSEAANAPSTSKCNTTTNTCEANAAKSCACPTNNPTCDQDALCSAYITCCADHLEMQLFPVDTWGTDYVAVRSFPRRNELDVWRILAKDADTEVTLTPAVTTVPTLAANGWFEFEATGDFEINATKPIMVGQFLAAQDSPSPGTQIGDAGTGDPAFILIAPTRQFRTDYAFLAPNKYVFDYVSIAAPLGAEVLLDGAPVDASALALVSQVGTSNWRSIRVPISDGFHQLLCSEPCSLMVHGYDQYVSYGYPGGLNLDDETP